MSKSLEDMDFIDSKSLQDMGVSMDLVDEYGDEVDKSMERFVSDRSAPQKLLEDVAPERFNVVNPLDRHLMAGMMEEIRDMLDFESLLEHPEE